MTPLLTFFICLFATFIFTPQLSKTFKRLGIVDSPGGRRIHKNVIPKMGGVVITVVGLIVLTLYLYASICFVYLLLSFLVIIACAVFDDIFELNCIKKFICQNVSSVLLILFLQPYFTELKLFGIIIPDYFDLVVLHVFIVGALNAVNLLDGLDGLLSGFSLLVFAIILSVAALTGNYFLAVLSASLMGTLLGFLRYNSFPASIFLGDTGSLSLGFLLVFSTIFSSLSITPFVLDLTLPVILLALPLVDCVKVFCQRILNKQNP